MTERPIRLFVGFDQKEALAYHVFCQSVLERASVPVAFYPLNPGMLAKFDGRKDGSNAFTVARYLTPFFCDFNGWALFADGDMVIDCDMAKIWEWVDVNFNRAVAVVKHDYRTKHPRKYIGSSMESKNEDYPRKNWSSLMLWNCGHFANRVLTKEYVSAKEPAFLHRLSWLEDKQIGDLPHDFNYLVEEDAPSAANLYHFTLGVPGIKHYRDVTSSWKWHAALMRTMQLAGENPVDVVKRAEERVGL